MYCGVVEIILIASAGAIIGACFAYIVGYDRGKKQGSIKKALRTS